MIRNISMATILALTCFLTACAGGLLDPNGQDCGDLDCGPNTHCPSNSCECLPGYWPSDVGCADINECAQENGGCEHLCTNNPGGFACDCPTGSVLASDGRSCGLVDPCPGCTICADPSGFDDQIERAAADHDALTNSLPERPIEGGLAEDTNGTLRVSLHPEVLPVLASDKGVFVAATQHGAGRIVAFSGQDFLSSQTRSTLLDQPGVAGLVTKSVAWAAGTRSVFGVEVLAANDAVAGLLRDDGATTRVASVLLRDGLLEIRDWSPEALAGVDVAIVQVNEFGTLHLSQDDVSALRAFVELGGGLLIAGSALNWSWWLDWTSDQFPGDSVLAGTGISWTRNSVRAVDEAQFSFDAYDVPLVLWCGYVRGAEVPARLLSRLSPLMVASPDGGSEFDLALARVLNETPPLPVARETPRALLSANVGIELRGHAWPQPHPWAATFPGPVPDDAVRVTRTREVDTRWRRIRPLALYAPPGGAIRVQIPARFVSTGLTVRVGDPHDDNRFLEQIDEWKRAPLLVQDTPLDRETVSVGSGLGGSMYLLVPDDYALGNVSVTVEGAVEQAFYDCGSTGPGTFEAALDNGAPQAILQYAGKVRLVVGTDAAREVDDPAALLDFWARFYDSHRALSGEPTPRDYESHWLFDVQVGHGYANATPERINYPPNSEAWALRTRTADQDWNLFAHELGHQFQTDDWHSGGLTEVTVDLFSMYTQNGYINRGGAFETRGFKNNRIDHAALRDSRWATADNAGKSEMYRQLVFEFGWPVYEAVFASYYHPLYPRELYGSGLDGFAIRFSALSGRNILPFLEHWGYPLSDEARATLQSALLLPWLPPGW